MNNINQHLYAIYQNINSFYDYRGLVPLTETLSQDKFISTIQKDKYLILPSVNKLDVAGDSDTIDPTLLQTVKDNFNSIQSTNEEDTPMPVVTVVLLVYPNTECESKRAIMVKMLNRINYDIVDVLIITSIKVSTGISKSLYSMSTSKRSFRSFTYTLFNSILPEHELVPKYEILNKSQIDQLKDCLINPDMLPSVFENDPQMIWLGARVGDVVKFVYPSEITIESIGYCKIVPNM